MFNVFKVDSRNGIAEYNFLLVEFGHIEPYFHLKYIEIFGGGLKNLICYIYKSEISNNSILMIGHLKPIDFTPEATIRFDFITPYGYTGPLFTKDVNETEIKYFWKEVDIWNKKNGIVTQFIRFNLNSNHEFYNGEVLPTMLNIKGKIINEDSQWRAFEHKVRKNINTALRENLTCNTFYMDISDTNIKEFHDIYIETMVRTSAKECFMYSIEKFIDFIKSNPELVAICTVYFQSIPVSSELLLISKDTIYSFLGGTNEKYFDKRPNDFLKVQAINWARNKSKDYYVLGGGYGFEDGIFKYKKSFFPNDVVKFYTGRKVVDENQYNVLINKYNNSRINRGLEIIEIEKTNFFPLYNLPFDF